MNDAQQTFKLYSPSGDVIMTGSMNAIMERLPDTHARNDALSTMLDTAVKQMEAEEKLEDARACAAQILSDGITRLATRLDGLPSIFCPLLYRQLHKDQPAGPHDACVDRHDLLIVHVARGVGLARQSCRGARLLHLGES